MDIDWQGAQQIREKVPESTQHFVAAIRSRWIAVYAAAGKIAKSLPNEWRKRLEMSHYAEYDYLIVNDDFDTR